MVFLFCFKKDILFNVLKKIYFFINVASDMEDTIKLFYKYKQVSGGIV